MRVIGQPERGAVIPLVAITMVVLLGMGALAVDLGNGWQTRRRVIISTDAAALAAAQEYALGGTGCDALAASYVTSNFPSATMTDCSHAVSGGIGRVRVDANADVRAFFAPILGLGDFDAASTTIVRYGAPSAVTGLRPFAMCNVASQEFADWLADPTTTSGPIFIPVQSSNVASCHATDANYGNWGYTNFNARSPSNALTKEYIRDGYPNPVSSGTEGATCASEPQHCYPGSPGMGGNSVRSEFQSIVGKEVMFPVFDYAVGTGANTQLHIIYFVPATLQSFDLTGPDAGLTFVFSPTLAQGECCDVSETPTGIVVIQPCAVTPDDSACSS